MLSIAPFVVLSGLSISGGSGYIQNIKDYANDIGNKDDAAYNKVGNQDLIAQLQVQIQAVTEQISTLLMQMIAQLRAKIQSLTGIRPELGHKTQ